MLHLTGSKSFRSTCLNRCFCQKTSNALSLIQTTVEVKHSKYSQRQAFKTANVLSFSSSAHTFSSSSTTNTTTNKINYDDNGNSDNNQDSSNPHHFFRYKYILGFTIGMSVSVYIVSSTKTSTPLDNQSLDPFPYSIHSSSSPSANVYDHLLMQLFHPLSFYITKCDIHNTSSLSASSSYSSDQSSSYPSSSSSSSSNIPFTRNFVADAAEIASPAVVNIMTHFESFMLSGASAGSGFIISKDGYIVTNAHVVSQSKDGQVYITMWNGRKLRGFVHSMDEKSDIALVKISTPFTSSSSSSAYNDSFTDDELPVAKLGSSSQLRVGEFVVALGSPLQLQNTVTFGIVSALARHGTELGIAKSRSEYIQTDAAINVGNSGGPLVNLSGEVIGINTMKINVTGISFAIPIDTVIEVVKQLKRHKRVIRPYIGMKMANIQSPINNLPPLGRNNNNKSNNKRPHSDLNGGGGRMGDDESSTRGGVLILDVDPLSPAQRAGLQSGDIIVSVDEKAVKGVRDVMDAIGLEVGKITEFKILRRSSASSSDSGSGGSMFGWSSGGSRGSSGGVVTKGTFDTMTIRVQSAPENK